MKDYQIIEHGVVVGRFEHDYDRNDAFQRHFMDKGRMAYKKDVEMNTFKRGVLWSSLKKKG